MPVRRSRTVAVPFAMGTIATTGNTDALIMAPCTGRLIEVHSSSAALAANDTNYITFSMTNLGQSGGGSTAMLAASDANTTKATGGSALAASTKRTHTKNATSANLEVTEGDTIRIRAAATGTLAGTVANTTGVAIFERTA